MDLLQIEKEVVSAVKDASKIFLKGASEVSQKDGAANLVTNVDFDIQNFLLDRLHKILPQAGFFCEEEDRLDVCQEYVWVIDPIDGTTNFVRDLPECVISVGLLCQKKAVIAAVFAPRLDLMFTAVRGNGAYCNGKGIKTSGKTFAESLFCTGLCLYEKNLSTYCSEIIAASYDKCSDIRRFGACALEICYLALGRCDLFFEIRTYPWDYAAASLILEEAGGIIRGFHGEALDFESITMLVGANNTENFNKINTIISDIIQERPEYRKW